MQVLDPFSGSLVGSPAAFKIRVVVRVGKTCRITSNWRHCGWPGAPAVPTATRAVAAAGQDQHHKAETGTGRVGGSIRATCLRCTRRRTSAHQSRQLHWRPSAFGTNGRPELLRVVGRLPALQRHALARRRVRAGVPQPLTGAVPQRGTPISRKRTFTCQLAKASRDSAVPPKSCAVSFGSPANAPALHRSSAETHG